MAISTCFVRNMRTLGDFFPQKNPLYKSQPPLVFWLPSGEILPKKLFNHVFGLSGI
jgi:hypothetical protein